MTTDLIRYDLLAQDALRGVVKRVLADAARDGLPGEHHFYISFKTQYPGVKISARMAEKYPDEITIVLQHQFWDLTVSDFGFEVGLSFGNAPEKLVVPFDAVCGFYDPSAQFGLKFEVVSDEVADDVAPPSQRPGPRGAASEPAEAPARQQAKLPSAKTGKTEPAKTEPGKGEAKRAETKDSAKAEPGKALPAAQGTPAAEADGAEAGGEKIVSLDKFRKKK